MAPFSSSALILIILWSGCTAGAINAIGIFLSFKIYNFSTMPESSSRKPLPGKLKSMDNSNQHGTTSNPMIGFQEMKQKYLISITSKKPWNLCNSILKNKLNIGSKQNKMILIRKSSLLDSVKEQLCLCFMDLILSVWWGEWQHLEDTC